ncbi:MAG: hypothetical protein LBL13_03965 [Bacteroidales bacterium]|jgi:hypothetical protein|nr:hypothetical protein [Bacteroidales bacterium]
MEDKHVESIPDNVLEEAQTKVDEAIELLAPYLVSLTSEERRNLLKMGEKTLSFVEKSKDYAHRYSALCPSYLDLKAFDADMADATRLRTLLIVVKQLMDNIEDTSMVAGSEALQAALIFYNAAKAAAAQNIPGAKEVHKDLKVRFPKVKRKKEEEKEEEED